MKVLLLNCSYAKSLISSTTEELACINNKALLSFESEIFHEEGVASLQLQKMNDLLSVNKPYVNDITLTRVITYLKSLAGARSL